MVTAWESLHFAILELVRATPIKQRLVNAYRRHLSSIRADSLPQEVRESFIQVVAMLGCVQPLRGEEGVVASVRKLSIQEADDCAALIVEIYGVTARVLLEMSRAVQLHPGVELAVNN